MNTLLSWVKMVQAERGLTFDAAFRLVMSHHTGSFGRPTKSGDAALIAKAKAQELPPLPPSLPSSPPARPKLFLVKGSEHGLRYSIWGKEGPEP